MNFDPLDLDEEPRKPDDLSRALPSGIELPQATAPLIITNEFNLSMIDANISGARLFVRQISRFEAQELAMTPGAVVLAHNNKGLDTLERELGIPPLPRPKVRQGQKLLVSHWLSYKEVHWFLVEYESDGDGCIE